MRALFFGLLFFVLVLRAKKFTFWLWQKFTFRDAAIFFFIFSGPATKRVGGLGGKDLVNNKKTFF